MRLPLQSVGPKVRSIYPITTHKLESVFGKLLREQESAQNGKPDAPTEHLWYLLHVHHTKDENEFVEDKVPEFVSHVLVFHMLQFPEDDGVDELDQEEETATGHVQHCLKNRAGRKS